MARPLQGAARRAGVRQHPAAPVTPPQRGGWRLCAGIRPRLIAGKLKNSRGLLLRAAREAADADEQAQLTRAADNIAASLRALAQAQDLDTLRGVEGEAARGYFAALNLVVKPQAREHFALNGRTRRPPLDRFNALLSFLYSMLMNDCRSALEAVGLDPQLGYLHAVRPGRAALALDLAGGIPRRARRPTGAYPHQPRSARPARISTNVKAAR
jgi:hypothetical protein